MQPLTTMSADKTDTDVFPEHLPSGKNLYYKGPILQKITQFWVVPSLIQHIDRHMNVQTDINRDFMALKKWDLFIGHLPPPNLCQPVLMLRDVDILTYFFLVPLVSLAF